MSRKEALSQFINQIHGRAVVVKLNSGVDYRGKQRENDFLIFHEKLLAGSCEFFNSSINYYL